MSVFDFEAMPDSARVWVYGISRPLTAGEEARLGSSMSAFLEQWTAHKRELRVAWNLRYSRFIVIAVDEIMMGASGCSIDAMIRHLATLEGELGCQIIDTAAQIFYRDANDEIQMLSRQQFKNLVKDKIVDENTVVFDNTIPTLGALKHGDWETQMKATWHQRAFPVSA